MSKVKEIKKILDAKCEYERSLRLRALGAYWG
jgi:hypothetical protein